MKTNRFAFALLASFLFLAVACKPSSNVKEKLPQDFPYAAVPGMITEQSDVMSYLAENFWTRFLDSIPVYSKDTALVGGVYRDAFGQAVFRYADLLSNMPVSEAYRALATLSSRISTMEFQDSGRVFRSLVDGLIPFLYDPNSNFRSEELMIPVLEAAVASPYYSEMEKVKFEMDLKDCKMNRIGEIAADFRFTDVKGCTSALHKIKADRLLIFFSNPGCNACMEIIQALSNIPQARHLVDVGELKVLNMYIDEDLAAWRDYVPVYPTNWISAYDPDMAVKNVPLYNIRAIPSLYLLDKDKRVLLKDATPQALFRAIGVSL